LKTLDNSWRYYIHRWDCSQKQFNYIYKYLNFDKLDKDEWIQFNNKEVGEWFRKTYVNNYCLEYIYENSPLGYEWLKSNWDKGVFEVPIYYSDKQELKTIVNKIINKR